MTGSTGVPEELLLLRRATSAVANAGDLADALRDVLHLVMQRTGWLAAAAWLCEADALLPSGDVGALDVDVATTAWRHNRVAWGYNNVAVPVLAADELVAVFCFNVGVRTVHDDAMVDVVALVTAHLGSQIRRRQLEDRVAAVQHELARYNRELEAANEDLRRSNADLVEFAYVASHDLSEPLRVISGHVQLLARRYEGKLGDDADRYIAFAVDGCNRMQSLIKDLLEYARVGQSPLATKDVDCNRVMDEVMIGLSSAIADGGADVQVGVLPEVHGDPGQLRELFANLVANAVKFTVPGEVPVVTVAGVPDGRYVRFAVADHGIGVPERHRERIFRMFQRLHAREDYEGTGIGLAICRRIVERHGGRIEVEDTPGGGATLVFTLPASRKVFG
ncbi:MAG TPA: ATP-binding protein [Acidimicrobiales bacterium]|nr:ATP-binding protein [Acidimicrobiales bacterium]